MNVPVIDCADAPTTATPAARPTASMLLAESTNTTQRMLIDVFSRLSTRQREAIYAMRQHGRMEKLQDKWHVPGHAEFAGKIVCCLCDAGLVKLVIAREYKRIVHFTALTPSGVRMMKAVESLDAVFFRNVFEIGVEAK